MFFAEDCGQRSKWSEPHFLSSKILLSESVVNVILCAAIQSIDTVSPFFYNLCRFHEISSTALRTAAIEIHVTVCGLQATHRPTIVAGLLRQSCLIKVSLLDGVWMANRGVTPQGLRRILRELRERGFRWYVHAYTVFMVTKSCTKFLILPTRFSQDFVSLFMGTNLVQKSSKIFRWSEMCSLGKILGQDFQTAAVTKILMRRDKSIASLLSLGDKQKTLETQKRTQ